jgi:hypothetical protein
VTNCSPGSWGLPALGNARGAGSVDGERGGVWAALAKIVVGSRHGELNVVLDLQVAKRGFLTLVPRRLRLADLYHTGGWRPKQNSPGHCLQLAPHVLLAHRKLQQNKQLTTGIPLSAARCLPAGKISRKPRGGGAEGRQRGSRPSPLAVFGAGEGGGGA